MRDRGLTLVELIVAIMVLSIGTLAVMRTLDQSARVLAESPARLMALSVAQNRAAELRAFGWSIGQGLPQTVAQGPHDWQVTTRGKQVQSGLFEVVITVSAQGQPGAVLTSFAPVGPAR